MKKRFMLLSAALLAFNSYALDVVRDGKAVSEIVLAPGANESQKIAADELRMYFKTISGAIVDIVAAPSGKFKNEIYVGENEFTKKLGFDLNGVERGGYKLVVGDDYAIVAGRDLLRKAAPYNFSDPESVKAWRQKAGAKFPVPSVFRTSWLPHLGICVNDDTGTWYAACELLEQAGVRWYAPGENGTVVPKSDHIRLEKQNLVKSPRSAVRELYIYTTGDETQRWLHRLRCGNSLRRSFNHTTWEVIGKEVREEYPEIMAKDKNGVLIGGQRNAGVPKLTDPTFRKLSMQYLRAVFDSMPFDLESHSLGMPDGLGAIDYQDSTEFKIGDTFENRFSNYVWDYWSWAADELKTTHPDRLLECAGYPPYFGPPDNTALVRDNVSITMCYWTSWLMQPQKRNRVLDTRDQWLKLLPPNRLRVWDYFLFFYSGREPKMPPFYTAILQEDMKALDGKCVGKFIEVVGDKGSVTCPGIMHFLIYWQSMLFWNPDADRQKVMDEYYILYFGPAAKEMKEFYEFAEQAFCNPVPLHRQTVESLKKHNGRYFEILSRARAVAGKDSVYDTRIAEIESEIQSLKKMHESLERTGPPYRLLPPPVSQTLDADPAKYKYGWVTLKGLDTGEDIAKDKTDVVIVLSGETLYVMAVCYENNMKGLKADCTKSDDCAIFNDDVVEVYVATPEHSYFKVVVNPNGMVYDESTDPDIIQRNNSLSVLWNPGTKAVVKKLEDRWVVELAIPTKDFGMLGPTKEYTWGIQIGRTRLSSGRVTNQALAPTGGRYDVVNRWGNLWSK